MSKGIKIPEASASQSGVVTTGTQTIAGAKTFTSPVKVDSAYTDKKTISVPNSTATPLWVLSEGTYLISVKSITNTLAHGVFLAYVNGVGTVTITTLQSASCSLTSPSANNVSITHTLGATYSMTSSMLHLNF